MNRSSALIAGGVLTVFVLWMASGYLGIGREDAEASPTAPPEVVPPMTVQVRLSEAEAVQRRLESQGEVRADRNIVLRAQTGGRVVEVLVERGARVESEQPLLRIDRADRPARLAEAEALVAQREADYEAARNLGDRGLQAETRVREAFAALQAARADLAAIREDLAHTVVRAPFAGVVDERLAEVGDVLSSGDPAARLVDLDPLRVRINVAQQNVGRLSLGAAARIELATGQALEGRVSFISVAGDTGTRTFPVDIEATNPNALPAGVSATVRLPLDTVRAHFLSPALLTLGDGGVLGVKSVDDAGRVGFHPVSIVRTDRDGVWVTGPPDRVRLITIGQGFVRAGERVETVTASESGVGLDDARAPQAPPMPGAGG